MLGPVRCSPNDRPRAEGYGLPGRAAAGVRNAYSLRESKGLRHLRKYSQMRRLARSMALPAIQAAFASAPESLDLIYRDGRGGCGGSARSDGPLARGNPKASFRSGGPLRLISPPPKTLQQFSQGKGRSETPSATCTDKRTGSERADLSRPFRASPSQDVCHCVIALVTRIFQKRIVAFAEGKLARPGLGEGRWIVHGEAVHQRVRIGARQPFNQVHVFVCTVEIVNANKIRRVNHQRIALPMAARIAHVAANTGVNVRAIGERNKPPLVHHLLFDGHKSSALDDPQEIIVRRWDHR